MLSNRKRRETGNTKYAYVKGPYYVYSTIVPAGNYWSVVLYDADTRALLNNGEPFPSIASNQKVNGNKDGSVDMYFGPTQPKDKNANWIKTVPGKGYFIGIRLYSPTQAFFDQTWKPDNIEKVK